MTLTSGLSALMYMRICTHTQICTYAIYIHTKSKVKDASGEGAGHQHWAGLEGTFWSDRKIFFFCLNLYIVFCAHFTFKGKKLNIKIWSYYAIGCSIERDVFYGCVAMTGTC